jgi:hypothetical protein
MSGLVKGGLLFNKMSSINDNHSLSSLIEMYKNKTVCQFSAKKNHECSDYICTKINCCLSQIVKDKSTIPIVWKHWCNVRKNWRYQMGDQN